MNEQITESVYFDKGYNKGAEDTKESLIKEYSELAKQAYNDGYKDALRNKPKNNVSINYPPLEWTDDVE